MDARRRKYPRIGKIRLGEKKVSPKSGKEYPAALDRFNFVDVPWVAEHYKEPCRELNIVLPNNDRDYFFPQRLAAYRTGGLFCSCDDGETASRSRLEAGKDAQGEKYLKELKLDKTVEIGTRYDFPCPYKDCGYYIKGDCKRNGRFLFMLPSVQQVGVYEIATSSWNSIANLNDYLEFLMTTIGRVSGIPLTLKLGPHQSSVAGKKKIVQVLSLVFPGTWDELLGFARAPMLALPSADDLPSKTDIEARAEEVPDDLVARSNQGKPAPQPTPSTPKERVARARAVLTGQEDTPEAAPEGSAPQPEEGQSPPPATPPKGKRRAVWR